MWSIAEMTREHAEAIALWRYPEPYSLYDSSPDDIQALLDPQNQYFAVVDESGDLVGHGCFGRDARVPGARYEHDAIDWGTGMRPDLTGRGHGLAFFRLVCDEARRRWPGTPLRTTVATFNERSAQLVRKLGFREVEIFRNPANREFVVFVYAWDTPAPPGGD
jgi:RimJ/RimL family protein N-acetyltransferase